MKECFGLDDLSMRLRLQVCTINEPDFPVIVAVVEAEPSLCQVHPPSYSITGSIEVQEVDGAGILANLSIRQRL